MSIKPSHILGLNGRTHYTKLNPSSAKKYGFSKLRTKELLSKNDIPSAQIYHVFESVNDLEAIDWENIPVPFVIKPASGSAGKGIWVIKKKLAKKNVWKTSHNVSVSGEEMSLHISNILDGEFSTWGSNHKAIVEEMIPSHPSLAKYAYKGTPDIRVIVFNSVPIMAQARIPTQESNGKANLDQGAIGLGIDMATGITTDAIQGKSNRITHFPHNNKKVNGIKIPHWKKILEISVQAANAAGYVFMGADIFIHPEKGPMIVELNGYPGLSIQLANRAGLKRRIQRVEGLDVRDAIHGVKIAQALFAENFSDNIKVEEGLQIISTHPTIMIKNESKRWQAVPALINTGRFRSAIGSDTAKDLGLLDIEDLLWQQRESIEGKVPVVEAKIKIKNQVRSTGLIVTKRLNRSKHKVELGRRDLQGWLIGETDS